MKKHIGLLALILMLFVMFSSCEQNIETHVSYDTPTAVGRVVLPEGVSVPYESIFVKVLETGNVYAVKSDGSYAVSNLEAGKKYTLLFQNKEFSDNTRGLGFDTDILEDLKELENVISKLIAGRKENVEGSTGSGFDNGVTVMKKTAAIAGKATLNGMTNNLGIDVFIPGTSFGAKTKADGSFRITGIMEGNDYTLAYMYPGYIPVESDPFNIAIDDNGNNIFTIDEDVVLSKASGTAVGSVNIQGDVIDDTLFDNVSVSIINQKNPAKNYTTPILKGAFQKEGIEPGIYKVEVSLNGYRKGVSESIEVIENKVSNFGEISLVPYGKKISGNVILQGVSDAAGISILATNTEKKVRYSTVTDTNGYFVLDNCIPGEYTIQYAKTGFGTEKISVSVDDNTQVSDCSLKKQFEIILKNDSDIQIIHANYGSTFTVPSYVNPGFVSRITDAEGASVNAGDIYLVKSDMEFTWDWVKACNVSFANTDLESIVVAQGDIIKVPETSRTGYIINSITLSDGTSIDANETILVTEDMIITWDWSRVYTVSFSGITRMPEQVLEGSLFTVPEISNTGFVIEKIVDANGTEWKAGDTFIVNSDIRLTWHWADAYVISFDGIVRPSEIVKSGSLYTVPFAENNGYVLVDIKDGSGKVLKSGEQITVNGDTTLTWSWKKLYTIDFAGVDLGSKNIVEGNTFTVPEVVNDGFELGYIEDQTGRRWKANDLITVDRDLKLTYHWIRLYTVTFNGTDITPQQVRENSSITIPELKKDGYVLDRITDAYGRAADVGNEYIVNENLEFNWSWKKLYTLSFTGIDRPIENIADGGVFVIPEISNPGHLLNSIKDGVGKEWKVGDSVPVASDINLIWVWDDAYTVKFEGTTMNPVVVKAGSSYVVPFFENKGYSLVGIKDGTGRNISSGDSITVNGDITLTWTWKKLYTINLVGTELPDYNIVEGNTYKVPEVTNPDHELVSITDQSGKEWKAGDLITVDRNLTLVYKWVRLYDVTFVGIDKPAIKVRNGESIIVPVVEKSGYESDIYMGTGQKVNANGSIVITGDTCLTWKWIKLCSISFVGIDHPTVSVRENSPFNIPTVANNGYRLKSITDGLSNTYTAGNRINVTSDMTLTWNWKKLYTVTYVGIFREPEIVEEGSEFVVPEITMDGMTAIITDADSVEKHVGDVIVIEGDLILTWTWKGQTPAKDFTYVANGDGVTITGYEGISKMLVLPFIIDGNPVTEIGNNAFAGYTDIEIIKLPETLKRIDTRAFYGCSNLKSIELNDGLVSIEGMAFENCTGLTNLILPNTLNYIGKNSFKQCCNISSIVIPSSVKRIEEAAFSGWNNLQTITFSPGLETMNWNPAWKNECNAIVLEDFLYEINGDIAVILGYTGENPSITLPAVISGKPVKEIANNAFKGLDFLTEVKIPNSVERIGWRAFQGCTGIKDIWIPVSVVDVDEKAFLGWTSNQTIHVESANNANYWTPGWNEGSAARFTTNFEYTDYGVITRYLGSEEHLVIPAVIMGTPIKGIECFGPECLYGDPWGGTERQKALKSVEISEGIQYIYGGAFNHCENLETVILPSTLVTLGGEGYDPMMHDMGMEGVFANCNISNIVLPDSLTKLGAFTFYGNPLRSLHIPESVSFIGARAIPSSTNITIDSRSPYMMISDGCLIDIPNKRLIGIQGTEFTIPSGGIVESIAPYVFKRSSLTTIVIPEGVKYLEGDSMGGFGCGGGVFAESSNLSYVSLPSTLIGIGDEVFIHCPKLQSIELPASLKSIGNGAFGESGLINVVVPENVESIGYSAFAYNRDLKSIQLPSSLKNVGYSLVDNHLGALEVIRIKKGTDMSKWDPNWSSGLDDKIQFY